MMNARSSPELRPCNALFLLPGNKCCFFGDNRVKSKVCQFQSSLNYNRLYENLQINRSLSIQPLSAFDTAPVTVSLLKELVAITLYLWYTCREEKKAKSQN